ncbi:MAG: CDP-glycerol glycerophosphotransferase family protein [Spirochaetia bacterium]|nr:CDP-glycerol glycerophosphotransferase family protein [Spirochaetia bacterium]MCI5607870.1 CDP-glycerol glycerophosphotransferase family protein [Spirochaetia bacterium]MCI7798461.1 CDP-glycerol glycerophosphotransferase family protein [Spirochaetia bacterium]MDD5790694.1 CDP-glycerol glycerophosphotransferase family protein [Spirochaetia bacterium]MDD6654162.1 CDP-glycerol glycerophosphotransferase family protein [Treponema sp.]
MIFFPLYIDPGTGSMLFSLAIGIATAGVFALRSLVIKFKFIFSGGKADKTEKDKIPYVIYSDHKRYWNVFKPICDEFERRGIDLLYLTQSEDDPCLSCNYTHIKAEFIGEGNKGFSKLNFLNAEILLSTTPGLDVYQWKRSKNVKCYVHIPHSADDVPATYRMFGTDYYDVFLTSGNHQEKVIRKLEELRNLPKKEIVCIGSTYLDSMMAKKDLLPVLQKNENPVILLAPSWGKNGILSKFGSKIIDALIQTGWHIVIRPHPQSIISEKEMLDGLKQKYSQIEWNFDNDNFNILNRADLLISDFSGVIYDFSLIFNKPIIYADTNFDTLPYDADWLDEQIWSLRVLPKIGIKLEEQDFPNLKNVIETALKSRKFEKGRQEVKDECWRFEGESVKRTVDYIIAKSDEL